MKHKEAW